MIAEIVQKNQYGKMGKIGINLMQELDDNQISMFAHSTQDAVNWITKFPMFQDCTIDDLGDGRIVIHSQWVPFEEKFEYLFSAEDLPRKNAEYTRVEMFIHPRNTIYENVGFEVITQNSKSKNPGL